MSLSPDRSAARYEIGLDELQRQLLRCRRREESGELLVARIERSGGETARSLRRTLRATDGVEIRVRRSSIELRAMLDGTRIERGAVERRLTLAVPQTGVRCGWARFPDDGLTLASLVRRAEAQLPGGRLRRLRTPAMGMDGTPSSAGLAGAGKGGNQA